ncbi:hypothetical protein [Nocardioides plantarum]|uniref:Integral membrane protein n=1 Tax=Nocardioides plantarum TaxID=29299 RepID=A0ABV5K6J0_9ACTN|nr:hypothetical protein [Nocardioides plantarum]
MDDGTIGFSYDDQLTTLLVQAVVWLVVVVACAVAVRRPWAWFGLAGGVVGLAVAVTLTVDALQVRSALKQEDGLGAHVFDTEHVDYPGFLLDHDIDGLLNLGQTGSLALLAAAFVVGAVTSRRRDRATAA